MMDPLLVKILQSLTHLLKLLIRARNPQLSILLSITKQLKAIMVGWMLWVLLANVSCAIWLQFHPWVKLKSLSLSSAV